MSKTIFLDTNIFLHYQDIDQIDWRKILNTDSVKIVIPPITIRELNKSKDSPTKTKRIRKRAGSILRKFYQLFQNCSQAQISNNIEMVLEARDPIIDFNTYQLNRDIQDDHLIASIIAYKIEFPEVEIVLITSDIGLTLLAKANLHRISTIRLDDNLLLPEEPDPEQEKLQQLEKELRQLKHKMPQLSLVFEDYSQYATFVINAPVELTQEEIVEKSKEIKVRYPRIEPASSSLPLDLIDKSDKKDKFERILLQGITSEALSLPLNTIASEDIMKYNEKLEQFYSAYLQYFQKKIAFGNCSRRTIKLAVWLYNDGTAPAEDIDIFMHFPDGFALFSDEDLPESPNPPDPPSKPKTTMEKLLEHNNQSAFYLPHIPNERYHDFGPSTSPPNVSSSNIKRTNSYDVEIYVQHIKHNLREPFDNLYVVFDSYDSAQSFQLKYEILAANLPSKIEGTLHVVISKDCSTTSI